MASKQTYECYVCKNNGFPGVMIYLAGKDDHGRAIRLEDDRVTPHTHKTKVPSQQVQQEQLQRQEQRPTTETTELLLQIKLLHQKLDQIIDLLKVQQQPQQQESTAAVSQSESTQLNVLSARLEYAISLLQKLTEAGAK